MSAAAFHDYCRWETAGDGTLRYAPTGELDWDVRSMVAAALRAVPPGSEPLVVIDLSAVTFLDASTAGLLMQYVVLAYRRGGEVRIVGAGGPARRVLTIVGPLPLFRDTR